MTLAQLAELKRRNRSKAENKRSQKKSSSKKQKPANANEEIERQIDRAVSKIKLRFEEKIERAEKTNASKGDIERLESEMKIQIEKMKERIQNRFKKRKANSDK